MTSFNVNYTGGIFLSHTHPTPIRTWLELPGLLFKRSEKKIFESASSKSFHVYQKYSEISLSYLLPPTINCTVGY